MHRKLVAGTSRGSLFAPASLALTTALTLLPLAAAPGAHAQLTTENGCMQDVAGFKLGCTANDISIAAVTNINVTDPCDYPGDMVTFSATFTVDLTAQARHDVGLYFANDGDPNGDGALSGDCTISVPAYQPDPPWLDLDHTNDGGYCSNNATKFCTTDRDCKPGTCNKRQDVCGDIDSNHDPLFPVIEITAVCADPDGDGFLNLPNCTSWRQPGSNTLCEDPTDAFPGAPSKCNCDLDAQVPIPVPPAPITVTKTANPTSVDEPGGDVTFSVSVKNDSPFAALTITSLVDDIYGNLDGQGTCAVPQSLANGATYSCEFTAPVSGQGDTSQTDIVTAEATDANNNEVSDDDDATVAINDLTPSISVDKTASPTEVLEPGGNVTFTVTITNTSVADTVTIDSLVDDVHGNLDGQGTCDVPQAILPGGTYSCSFTAFVGVPPGTSETDIVTGSGKDEEGNPVEGSDSANVAVNNSPSLVELIKTAAPTSLDEPGGTVTFSFMVKNKSAVDSVTITSLTDTIYGNLNGQGTCAVPQTIGPGGSYSCSFSTNVTGNAGDSETDVATASGTDDDGSPVTDDDDATVNINDVGPAASLSKEVISLLVTYQVVVTNDSTAESMQVDSLIDDQFGDITQVGGAIKSTDCTATGQAIAVGDTYTCSFDAVVTTSPHADTVTGTVSDNDGGSVTPSDGATVTFGD